MKSVNIHFPVLPPPDDAAAVAKFAASFDGYEHFGSVEVCQREARARRRVSLVDIRNELFFEARASYHCNDDEYLDVYRELLPLFKQHSWKALG